MDPAAHYMKLLCTLAALAWAASAAPAASWTLIQNADFEIYSQQGDSPEVRASLLWFEQLRAFFAQAGLHPNRGERVRIIGFRSVKEYDAYRLRPTADAYYVGTESRDYIVMPSLGASQFGIAAHEYAHVVLHAEGLHLPPWLNEGLAEFFSTVRISRGGCELGGDIRSHSQTLATHRWMPLARLLETRLDSLEDREQSSVFYAQSWALVQMLLSSPDYRARFPELVAALTSEMSSQSALTSVFRKSLDAVAEDMRRNLSGGAIRPIAAPGVTIGSVKAISSELPPFSARCMLAELLLATGELDRAQALYQELAHEFPQGPEVSAALGTIALRKGDVSGAQLKWKQAIDEGITDAGLCYRYAVLADNAGVSAKKIRPALERAIALNPDLDDARFKLALLESNAANYESAVEQLKAMRAVAGGRGFGYWSAMAFAQDQLGHHDEARIAAQKALTFAGSDQERAQARQLAYIADTQLTVQFTRDANGNPQVSTARMPRGTQSWNPFVEPQDHMLRADGRLRVVECSNNKISAIAVETAEGLLHLTIPDPQHVLIQGATEFSCGPQPDRAVRVEYAAAPNSAKPGILRGMEMQPLQQQLHPAAIAAP